MNEAARKKNKTTEKKRVEEQAKRKEAQARICVAKDLARMESLAKKAKMSVKETMTLEEVKAALDAILPSKAHITPTDKNIKEWVAVTRVNTKCDSKFYFLVNVVALESGQLKFFRIWSENAPKGYPGGYGGNFPTISRKYVKHSAK